MRGFAPAAILILGTALTGCAYTVVSGGQIRRATFDSVLQNTVRAREIPLDAPVNARVVSQQELRHVLEDVIDAQWTEGELRLYERALVAVGLWPRDRNLREEYLAVMSDEIAGVYIPADEALYVVKDAPPPFSIRMFSFIQRRDLMVEAVLSHELVHLLQHQVYPALLDPALTPRDQDDLDFAIQSALEGDATRYGFQAMGIPAASLPPEKLKEQIEKEMESAGHGAFIDAPALIRFTLSYPYVEGYRLSYGEGPALLERPPASTEQVLHPSRRHEKFWVFDLGEAIDALPRRCVFEHSNTLGELQMSVLFRDLGKVPVPAAWEGWDGDRFLVAECDGQLEFAWLTSWDTEPDAREFESAYAGIASAVATRAGYGAPPRALRDAREVVVVSAGLSEWAGDLPSLARRRRVSTVEEVREHFGVEALP